MHGEATSPGPLIALRPELMPHGSRTDHNSMQTENLHTLRQRRTRVGVSLGIVCLLSTLLPLNNLNLSGKWKVNAMDQKFYRIHSHRLTNWGDYGDMLQHGLTAHLARVGGRLSLERTGPYMPPITFPGIGDIILTSAARKLLETSGLSGFTFRLVNKTRIVELRWHEWDLTSEDPREFPETGEPEDYILGRRPNQRIAQEMGEIWELVVPITAKIGRPQPIVHSFSDLYIVRDSWNGTDLFRGDGYGGVLVTERARLWLAEHFKGYTEFDEFGCK